MYCMFDHFSSFLICYLFIFKCVYYIYNNSKNCFVSLFSHLLLRQLFMGTIKPIMSLMEREILVWTGNCLCICLYLYVCCGFEDVSAYCAKNATQISNVDPCKRKSLFGFWWLKIIIRISINLTTGNGCCCCFLFVSGMQIDRFIHVKTCQTASECVTYFLFFFLVCARFGAW